MKIFTALIFSAVQAFEGISSAESVAAASDVTLSVYWIPSDGGSVSVSPTSSNGKYPKDTVVQLTATPLGNWRFLNWGESLDSTSNPIALTLDSDKTVSAYFGTEVHIAAPIHGTVHANRDLTRVVGGSVAVLTPIPEPGFYLERWTGHGSGSAVPYSFQVSFPDPTISASFLPLPSNSATLTAYSADENGGRVEIRRRDFGVQSQALYTIGEARLVYAIPNAGWAFTGWSGDATGNDSPLMVSLDASKTIVGHFVPGATITIRSADGGTVTKTPDQSVYELNASVTLEAHPQSGFTFAGWEGAISETNNPVTVTLDNSKTVYAKFMAPERNPRWVFPTNARAIVADAEGNAVVVTRKSALKISQAGTILWQTILHPTPPDGAPDPADNYDGVIDAGGNIIIPNWGGASEAGGYVARISKLRADGTLVKEFGEGAATQISVAADGTVYAPMNSEPSFYPISYWLSVFPTNGLELWSFAEPYYPIDPEIPVYTVYSRAAVGLNGRVYFSGVGAGSSINCLEASGGQPWKFPGQKGFNIQVNNGPVHGGNAIYVIDGSGRLLALTLLGHLKWQFQTAEILQPPSIGNDGILYFGAQDSPNLYALKPDGATLWIRHPGRPPYGVPAIGSDGTIYVTDADSLHALNSAGDGLWDFSNGKPLVDPIIAGANVYTSDGDQLLAFAANALGPANSPWPMIDASQFGNSLEQAVLAAPMIDVAASGFRPGGFQVVVHAEAGATVQIYRSSDLMNWSIVHTETSGFGDVTFLDAAYPPDACFYKASR